MPFDPKLLGEAPIDLAHPHALDAAKLIHRAAFGRAFPKSYLEHFAHDLQTRVGIKREPTLPEKFVGARAAWLPRRV
jgi:hypothetical protein